MREIASIKRAIGSMALTISAMSFALSSRSMLKRAAHKRERRAEGKS
jgi:hypothetical protein